MALSDDAPASSPPSPSAWPLGRGNPLSTGVYPGTLPEKLEVLWTFEPEKAGFEATAVIADGVVFVGSLDGEMFAVNLADGSEKWKFPTEAGFRAAAAFRDGRLYAGDMDGVVYCLDAATGEELWKFSTDGEISGAPGFYQDKLLVGSQDATLYCLNLDGTEAWRFTIGDQIRCGITVVENRAFLAGCDGLLHIVNLDTGESAASVKIGAPMPGSTPAVLGDRVYFGCEGDQFFCVDWRKATIEWTAEHGQKYSQFRSSAAVTEEIVVFGGQDGTVYALHPDGESLWDFPMRSKIDSSPVIVGQRAFIGGNKGQLYGLDLASGEVVFEYEAGGHFPAAPAVADGRLVIGNDDGTLYCFGEK
jgi:outer membrane protein assembly factor BamB